MADYYALEATVAMARSRKWTGGCGTLRVDEQFAAELQTVQLQEEHQQEQL
jgi:hypothetical protein